MPASLRSAAASHRSPTASSGPRDCPSDAQTTGAGSPRSRAGTFSSCSSLRSDRPPRSFPVTQADDIQRGRQSIQVQVAVPVAAHGELSASGNGQRGVDASPSPRSAPRGPRPGGSRCDSRVNRPAMRLSRAPGQASTGDCIRPCCQHPQCLLEPSFIRRAHSRARHPRAQHCLLANGVPATQARRLPGRHHRRPDSRSRAARSRNLRGGLVAMTRAAREGQCHEGQRSRSRGTTAARR